MDLLVRRQCNYMPSHKSQFRGNKHQLLFHRILGWIRSKALRKISTYEFTAS